MAISNDLRKNKEYLKIPNLFIAKLLLPNDVKERRFRLADNIILKLTRTKSGIKKDFYFTKGSRLIKKIGEFPSTTVEMLPIDECISLDILFNNRIEEYYKQLSNKTNTRVYSFMKKLNTIKHKDITTLSKTEIISICKKEYNQGKYENAKRLYSFVKNLLDYAIINDLVDDFHNPLNVPFNKLFSIPKSLGYSWIDTEDDLRELLSFVVECKVTKKVKDKLLVHLFLALRNQNAVNLPKPSLQNNIHYLYFSPKEMKTKEEFYLGITSTLASFIENIDNSSLSTNYLNRVLRNFKPSRMKGSKENFTTHSFRKVLATFSRNVGLFPVDYIDATLAHKVGTSVSRVYMKSNDIEITYKVIKWYQEYLFSLEPRLEKLIIT